MSSPPDIPHIPLLNSDAVLDTDDLKGEGLNIYVPCGDLVDGDEVELLWWGCAATGTAVDIHETVRFFEEDTAIPEPVVPEWPLEQRALPIQAQYARVILLEQGQVFCSYRVQKQSGGPAVESYRLFFKVGYPPLELPVAQLVQSHGGWVAGDLDRYTLVVPPFQAMAAGDEVTLVVDGHDDDYDPAPWQQKKTLTDSDRNTVLTWDLPPSYVEVLIDGQLDISYSVTYPNAVAGTSQSVVQRLRAGVPSVPLLPLLPEPHISGHTGDLLDPGTFPEGLQVTVETYPDAQIGDVLILHWQGTTEYTSTRKSLILDASNIHSGRLAFHIEPHWLADNVGLQVTMFYHYARRGRNQRSEPLTLRIRVPLELPPVAVTGATLLADQTYAIKALALRNHVSIVVPAEANHGPDDPLTVTWAAPGSGYHRVSAPTVEGGRTYQVPPQYVPAAMNQQIEVFYTVEQDGIAQRSRPYQLFVEGLAPADVRPVRSDAVDGSGNLYLSQLPPLGTRLEQPAWVFKAPTQTLSMWLVGTSTADTPLTETIAQDRPVLGSALDSHFEAVEKQVFERFKRNVPLDIHVTVRFDSGQAPISFRTLPITVRD
jgi:hypothetical protein